MGGALHGAPAQGSATSGSPNQDANRARPCRPILAAPRLTGHGNHPGANIMAQDNSKRMAVTVEATTVGLIIAYPDAMVARLARRLLLVAAEDLA
jgi:hypothetical protein